MKTSMSECVDRTRSLGSESWTFEFLKVRKIKENSAKNAEKEWPLR